MELLGIPFKRTLQVDLQKHLGELIDKTSLQSAAVFQDDLETVQRLRDSILDSDLSEQSLKDHVAYYYTLSLLSHNFPRDQIKFTWFQTLSTNSISSSQYSFNWDRYNVLYNIAALLSLMAIDLNPLGNSGNLTLQCKYFQISAVILNYLITQNNNVSRSQDEDLSSSKAFICDLASLKALQNMMMAQAMECYWKKAIADGMKDKIIAKMSSQVVTFYDQTIHYSEKSILIRADWIQHFQDKKIYFQSSTLYRMATDYHSKEQYGLEISCYNEIKRLLSRCKFDTTMFQKKVNESLNDIERDNDFIYNQLVPEMAPSLVKPMNMLKVDIPMEEILFKNVNIDQNKLNLLFEKLLPVEVMESATVFKERKTKYIQDKVISPLQALNKLLKEKTIETSGNDCNVIKLAKLHSVSPDELSKFVLALGDLKQNQINVQSQLNVIKGMLDNELQTDQDLRDTHGKLRWNLPESSMVNKPYLDKLNLLNKYLQQGIQVDSHTNEMFDSVDKDLVTADIKLPKKDDPLIKKVTDAMDKRDAYIAELEKKSWDNSILPKLIEDYRLHGDNNNFETVYLEHVNSTFQDDLKFIEREKGINDDLILNMTTRQEQQALETQNGSEGKMKRLDARELYIEDFKYSLKLLDDVKSNIMDASKFYEDLITSVNNFSKEVNEFVHSRNLQKQELNDKLCK